MTSPDGGEGAWTVALTRPAGKLDRSRRVLEDRGFRTIAAPMLEVQPVDDPAYREVLDALARGGLAYLVLTGATGVRHALARTPDLPARVRDVPVVAIGPRTRDALEDAGVDVHAVPDEHASEGLVEWFGQHASKGEAVGIVRSTRGTSVLPDGLEARGLRVLEGHVYDLVRPEPTDAHRALYDAALAGDVDAFTFTSSLTVEHTLGMAEALGLDRATLRARLDEAAVAAIGAPTRRTLEEHGVHVDVVPERARFEALAEGLVELRREGIGGRGARPGGDRPTSG